MELIIKPDFSAQKLIDKTAKALETKYNKKRKINQFILDFNKNGFKRFISFLFSILLVVLTTLCIMMGFSTAVNKINRTLPNFAGYSIMQVASGSMIASGFNVGDMIIIKTVDEKTIKVGDKISFYVNKEDYEKFDIKQVEELYTFTDEHKSNLTFTNFFGIQSKELQDAGQKNCTKVFHQVSHVYEDENGKRWFKTKGTSQENEDMWTISEDMVIGLYDNSALAGFIGNALRFLLTKTGIITVIVIPMSAIMLLIVYQFLKEFQYAKLELDVVEEKRKITDLICVKNQIGFRMDNKTKYKILAQADGDEKFEYLPLLWEKGNAPKNVKKYLHRKNILLNTNKKLLELNRQCQQDFKDGVKPNTIAKKYLAEKEKIEKEFKDKQLKLKQISIDVKAQKVSKKKNKVNFKRKKSTKVSKKIKKVENKKQIKKISSKQSLKTRKARNNTKNIKEKDNKSIKKK